MIEQMKPMDIEKRSFAIITELLGDRRLDPENELVIKRVIHTTADFDYVDNLAFSGHAVQKAIAALRAGCDIVTDTQMAKAGINKTILASLGGEVHCFMSDADGTAPPWAAGKRTIHLLAQFRPPSPKYESMEKSLLRRTSVSKRVYV